jgi:hypothetical protein
VGFEGSKAEPVDGGENVIGRFGPSEGLWLGIMGVDVGMDRCLKIRGRAVDATAKLLLGEQREEAFDLADPGGRGRREVNVPMRAFGEPVADELGLVRAGIVHDDMDGEFGRNIVFDGVEELTELAGAMAPEAPSDDLAGFTSSAANSESVPCRL